MSTDEIFHTALISATFLSSLVAGLLFAFAVVVMPGIRNLGDREFIRAFQVMDRIIQNNQPLFMLVWLGSAITLVVSAVLGFGRLDGSLRLLLVVITVIYLIGVQLPTIAINIPLNNRLQTWDADAIDETSQRAARNEFESRWNQWNTFRATIAGLTSGLLIFLMFRL